MQSAHHTATHTRLLRKSVGILIRSLLLGRHPQNAHPTGWCASSLTIPAFELFVQHGWMLRMRLWRRRRPERASCVWMGGAGGYLSESQPMLHTSSSSAGQRLTQNGMPLLCLCARATASVLGIMNGYGFPFRRTPTQSFRRHMCIYIPIESESTLNIQAHHQHHHHHLYNGLLMSRTMRLVVQYTKVYNTTRMRTN